MRYPDSPERSSELLRLTLPLMSKFGSGYHPISYAIWYEYASHRIPELTNDLTEVTATGAKLTDAATYRLYQQHIASVLDKNIARANGEIDRLLGNVADSMANTHTKTNAYASTLQTFGANLSYDAMNSGTMRDRIASVLQETESTTASIEVLSVLLQDSRQEVDKLREDLARTRDEAVLDPLTGIMNRRGFNDALKRLSAESVTNQSELSLLIIDIDHFKKVNDTYGHLLGDRAIRAVAQLLQSSIKGRDVAARFGGEEFAVLLPTTPIKGAVAVAEAIRVQMPKVKINRLDKDELIDGIAVSIGATVYRPHETFIDFVNRADTALYSAKQNGRNRVVTM